MNLHESSLLFLRWLFGFAFSVYVVLAVWASVYDPLFLGPNTIKKLDLLLWWLIGCGSIWVYMMNRGGSRIDRHGPGFVVKNQKYFLVSILAISTVVLWHASADFNRGRTMFVFMAIGLLVLSLAASPSGE